jgi:hypothetical protein
MAKYSPPAEKSTLETCPSGVPEVGQFENAVRDGMWIWILGRKRSSVCTAQDEPYQTHLVLFCLACNRKQLGVVIEPHR